MTFVNQDPEFLAGQAKENFNKSPMKPESLRIGNLLQLDGEIVEVQGIDPTRTLPKRLQHDPEKPKGTIKINEYAGGVHTGEISKWIWKFTPIPITLDMLMRSNLDQNKDYENRFTIHDEENHRRNSGRWVTRRFLDLPLDTPFMRFDGLCDCYYWHELQNLFFCLSGGKELTLKEE